MRFPLISILNSSTVQSSSYYTLIEPLPPSSPTLSAPIPGIDTGSISTYKRYNGHCLVAVSSLQAFDIMEIMRLSLFRMDILPGRTGCAGYAMLG